MRARIKKLLMFVLVMAGAGIAMAQSDLMYDLHQKDSVLTSRQRTLKDSLGAAVRSDMLSRVTDSRMTADTLQGPALQISLLTCGSGREIYEYYGHTAIRIRQLTDGDGFDWAFNYGVFDFNSGNFALRFALGHTDYICAMQPTELFIDSYRRNGVYVEEQVLNVTAAEARRLLDALLLNCRPENCVYRYNFFFDNCATRVRDKIEECLDGKLRYPERPTERTLRDAVHFYCRNHPWAMFGQDLLLGSEADIPATGRELEFAPLILQQDITNSVIIDPSGIVHLFADKKHRLVDLPPIVERPSMLLSPLSVAILMLVAVLLLGIWEWRKGRVVWALDTVLLALQGLAGIIVAFLFFFSTHPTVGSNWLVCVLNPLPLVGLYWQIKGGRHRRYWYYHAVALAVLTLFMLSLPAIPQYVSPAAKVLLLVLLLRSLTNVLIALKIRKAAGSQPQEPENHKLKNTIAPLVLTGVFVIPISAFSAPTAAAGLLSYAHGVELSGQQVPRVVVNVTIDGLRSDLLSAYMPLFNGSGFRLLMEQGCVLTNAAYPNYETNRASSIATLATGTVPYDHGIIDLQWLDRSTLRPTYCVEDSRQRGLNTYEQLSPRNVQVSTIGDELKVSTEGKALVYAFAPCSDAAILSAGHAADGAYWIDKTSGQWAGTAYYAAQLPSWIAAVNTNPQSLTPNERVTAMAQSCFRYTTLGNDEVPDYLAVTLTALDPAMESEDLYLQLDRMVSNLIATAEQSVGQGNTLFVLTSTATTEPETTNLDAYRIPTGSFYIDRTANLLNMMLIALYGQGNYVETTYGNQIYLNHKLIEQKQLNLSEVLDRCQELLLQSEGVKDAYSAQRLLLGAWTPDIDRIRNSYNPRLSGDIMVQVAPGWHLANETTGYTKLVREAHIAFPILFYGTGVAHKVDGLPASVDRIAPTLAAAMRIRAPNACKTIPFEIKQ
ncbi:MAG: alkaline phosphatase family protein [Bacteroidaceae bacterium]|nr:alkaline phosphatase family protein [Bacteroidaceae bacterium]